MIAVLYGFTRIHAGFGFKSESNLLNHSDQKLGRLKEREKIIGTVLQIYVARLLKFKILVKNCACVVDPHLVSMGMRIRSFFYLNADPDSGS